MHFEGVSRSSVQATEERVPPVLEDRVACPARAIASSGSTGQPKIIVAASPGEGVPEPPEASRTVLVPAPLYHTNGFTISHLSLFNGNRTIVMERFDAQQVVDLIERYQVNHVTMVPTMLLRIARLPTVRKDSFASLESVQQGGASCPEWLVRRWIEWLGPERFFMTYGSTENVGLTQIYGDEWLERPGSVGRGVDTEIQIVDEAGCSVPAGQVGEIFMRSKLSQEPTFSYLGAPPAKRNELGLTSVGDLGWLDEEGYLFIADRRKDLIVSGGANVFPAEVEAAISEHPDVEDVAVVGLPDSEWGQCVAALIQVVQSSGVAPEELRSHCRARLAAYKVPKVVEFVSRLPRLDSGKLNRSALAAEYSAKTGG